jgi:hypothetical protein
MAIEKPLFFISIVLSFRHRRMITIFLRKLCKDSVKIANGNTLAL